MHSCCNSFYPSIGQNGITWKEYLKKTRRQILKHQKKSLLINIDKSVSGSYSTHM